MIIDYDPEKSAVISIIAVFCLHVWVQDYPFREQLYIRAATTLLRCNKAPIIIVLFSVLHTVRNNSAVSLARFATVPRLRRTIRAL